MSWIERNMNPIPVLSGKDARSCSWSLWLSHLKGALLPAWAIPHIWALSHFPHKVSWSSLSWVSCEDVNCAVQLRPADGNTPYLYFFYSHCEHQLHGSPWKLYGGVMVMTLKGRHGLQRSPGMQRGVSEVYSSLLLVTITVAAGCELGAML